MSLSRAIRSRRVTNKVRWIIDNLLPPPVTDSRRLVAPGAGRERSKRMTAPARDAGEDSSAGRETAPVRISVCIPAYNEADVIAETVAEAAHVLRQISGDHEILVVDDGSSDGTGAILAELAGREPMLRPLTHARNRGNPAAQRTLVEAARGQYIFHIGADREWRMDEIPRMLARLEQGYDIVIGVRRRKQYSMARKLVSASFNLLVAALWGRHFGDLGSIKMARASLWKRVPFLSNSAFVHAQRVLIAHANGARITTVLVDHMARTTGKSSFANPRQAIRAARELIEFRLSRVSRYDIGSGCE